MCVTSEHSVGLSTHLHMPVHTSYRQRGGASGGGGTSVDLKVLKANSAGEKMMENTLKSDSNMMGYTSAEIHGLLQRMKRSQICVCTVCAQKQECCS